MRRRKRAWNQFDIIQLLIMAGLLAFIIVMLASSGSKVVPMNEIKAAMEGEPSIAELSPKTVQDAAEIMSFDAASVDEGIYYRVDDVMNVNELLIVRVEDDDNRESVIEAVSQYLEAKKNSFEGYGTDQFGLLSAAVMTEKGEYFFFGVSEHVLEWESRFLNCIS